MDVLNLEKQLLFYGSYHHNTVNVVIHIICVPIILMSSFQLATNTPAIATTAAMTIDNLPLNLGTGLAVLYSTLYVLMEPVAGGLLAPLLIGGTAFANHLTSTYGMVANYWSIGINVVAWIFQFIGHGVYEGKAPALLDNLVQAFFLAPLFVWLEVLFFLGYRPELKSRLDQAIEKQLSKEKAEKAKEFKKSGRDGKKTNGNAQ